jgi:hypothetical protein
MSENTQSAEKPAPKKKTIAEEYFERLYAGDKLTRVPVAHLFFTENIDHSAGWESQFSNARCFRVGQGPQNSPSRYYVADYIPAWQAFELTAVKGPDSEPVTELVPAAHVRRWIVANRKHERHR